MSNTNTVTLLEGDNLDFLKSFASDTYDLIVVDPPYGIGKTFQSHSGSFDDKKKGSEFIQWMRPRLVEAKRVLKDNGSFFIFGDYREIHYLKVELDDIFGRKSFQNEIIWNYDYGGRSKSKWSAKHDTILWYSKDPKKYTFNYNVIDRIPYLAPGLVGPEKAAKGKTPTDVWWQTIVPTNGKERLGWPTQKPIALFNRIIKVHSNPGDQVLDFFAGSGTTGDAAQSNGRNVTLIDSNPSAITLIKKRLCLTTPSITANNNPQPEKEEETTPSLILDPIQK
ncbi:MAG: site-specific DNA-methyltransferase [Candidatus Paceibacterota bacterium]|jgi:site-specific DNA-methyltransferase (adenine-specific)